MGRKKIVLNEDEIAFIKDFLELKKKGNLSEAFNEKFKMKISCKTLKKKYTESLVTNPSVSKYVDKIKKREIKNRKYYEKHRAMILSKKQCKYRNNKKYKESIRMCSKKYYDITKRVLVKKQKISYMLSARVCKKFRRSSIFYCYLKDKMINFILIF